MKGPSGAALDRGAGPGPGEVSVLIAAETIVALVVWLLTRSTAIVVIGAVSVLALYLVLMLFPAVRRRLAESPARACSVIASRR